MQRYHATSALSLTARHPARGSVVRQELATGVTGYPHMGRCRRFGTHSMMGLMRFLDSLHRPHRPS